MEHIMLDLETLGSNPRAPIASIGAVCFDPETGKIEDSLYIRVDLESYDSYYDHFVLDYSTVKWWMGQSNEAIKSTFTGELESLEDALKIFQRFVPSRNGTPIWGNGADFDNVILAYAYDVLVMARPWKFSNNRCFRTIKNLVGNRVVVPDPKVKHNALEDATWQAKFLSEAMGVIRLDLAQ